MQIVSLSLECKVAHSEVLFLPLEESTLSAGIQD
jgi:hypothetical protein